MTTTVPTVNDLHKLQAKDAAHDEANAAEDVAIAILRADLDALTARVAKLEGVSAPVEPPVVTAPVETVPPVVSDLTRRRNDPLPAIIKTPAELIASKLVPPLSMANVRDLKPWQIYPEYPRGSYAEVGLADAMGGTGERQDIGLVTDCVGQFLCGGSANNMLVQAEAHGDVPVHWLDGDRIYSIEDHPKVTSLAQSFNKDPLLPTDTTNPVKPDYAHYPALNYVAHLATGDQYYLEELQFAAAYYLISNNPTYRGFDKGLIYTGQTRGYAWGLRTLVSAYLATPEGDVPAPLLPKAYWGRMIENNRVEFERAWVNNGVNNPLTNCHFAVYLTKVGPWQQDFLGAIMGWMIYTGDPLLAKWRSNYEWHMRQAIDRTSGKAGYPRSRCIQYYYLTAAGDMASLAVANGLVETDNGLIPPTDQFRAYTQYLRANLKLAALNGISEAQECFDWLDPQVTNIPYKWAV